MERPSRVGQKFWSLDMKHIQITIASTLGFSDILVSLDDADIPLKEILPALAAFLFAGSKVRFTIFALACVPDRQFTSGLS